MKKKSAFIDQILLWFFLMAAVMVFIGTVSDELTARNKYNNLKKVLQSAVLSAAKYYTHVNADTAEAQAIALGVVEQTPLGEAIKNEIVFTWDFTNDPNNVIATITNYNQNFFWFRLLGFNSTTFTKVEAKANVILVPTDQLPIVDEVNDFMPFAVNECRQDGRAIAPGESFSFIYKPYDIYDANDSTGFYGLRSSEPDRNGAQDDFAHFKNEVFDFNRITQQQYLVNSILSSIENDTSQLSSALEVKKFEDPLAISIALVDCNSTKDNIIISNLVEVSMTNIYCGYKFTSEANVVQAFEDQTGDVFDEDITWINWTEDNDCAQSGLFRIDVDVSIPQIETVILEY